MKINRINDLERYIFEKKHVSLDHLCEEFKISKSTLRRDIDSLCKRGKISKTYGGVSANSTELNNPQFFERTVKNPEAKRKIAQKAASLVNDGDIIFIDTGTTTCFMIDYLADKDITIISNNLEIINGAVACPNIALISLSGTFDRRLNAFTGSSAAQVFKQYNATKAFMATAGFSINSGVTHSFYTESDIKALAIQRTPEIILLADSAKAGSVSLYTFCNLEQIHTLITEKNIGEEYEEALSPEGGRLLIAE